MKYRHLQGLNVNARFSDCGKYRYRLIIENPVSLWDQSVCVIMQNPSDADEYQADKSVHFLENLIFKKDYSLFKSVRKIVVVNQFAYIQKNDFVGDSIKIGPENDDFIREAIEECQIVLISWGKMNCYKDRQNFVFNTLAKTEGKIIMETKKHPSRGFYKEFLQPFKIEASS